MTIFAEVSPKERALIPNVMQPSPRYSIKREEIENKRVIHALTMNNRDKYKCSQGRNLLTQCTCVPMTR